MVKPMLATAIVLQDRKLLLLLYFNKPKKKFRKLKNCSKKIPIFQGPLQRSKRL